jgi:hypothetical protein
MALGRIASQKVFFKLATIDVASSFACANTLCTRTASSIESIRVFLRFVQHSRTLKSTHLADVVTPERVSSRSPSNSA